MFLSRTHPRASQKNLILAALPAQEYAHLSSHLEPIALARGKVLYAAGDPVPYGYFLLTGMVSLLAVSEDGRAIEVGMVGNEGMAGLPVILGFSTTPYDVVVQLQCLAMRIKAEKLKAEFNQGEQLHRLLLRYTHTLLAQISQSASCNIFHTVKQRLCRWLLIGSDRVHSDTLSLTQEFLAQMIGTPRTSVTMIAGSLQKAGLINYNRGKIQILDRAGLEAASCECYGIVNESITRYIIAA